MGTGKHSNTLSSSFMRLVASGAVLILMVGCVSDPEIDIHQLLNTIDYKTSPQQPVSVGPDVQDSGMSGMEGWSLSAKPSGGSSGRVTIQPDCLVYITVEEEKSLDGSYAVNEMGAIELGRIGPIFLNNRTEREASDKISEVLRSRDFKQATVTVKILRASYDKVLVVGAVNKPGEVKIGSGEAITLNDALRRAGGLRTSVRGARVKIVRGGLLTPFPTALDGEEFALETEEGKPSIPGIQLGNNDVISVYSGQTASIPDAGSEKHVYLLGEVSRQGIMKFAPNEPCTIMHLMFKVGGLPAYANKKSVKVIRHGDDDSEVEHIVDVEKILKYGNPQDDFPLENGDRIIVPARRLTLF